MKRSKSGLQEKAKELVEIDFGLITARHSLGNLRQSRPSRQTTHTSVTDDINSVRRLIALVLRTSIGHRRKRRPPHLYPSGKQKHPRNAEADALVRPIATSTSPIAGQAQRLEILKEFRLERRAILPQRRDEKRVPRDRATSRILDHRAN